MARRSSNRAVKPPTRFVEEQEALAELYCVCRSKWTGTSAKGYLAQCVGCNEWFHQKCEDLPEKDSDVPDDWHCRKCLAITSCKEEMDRAQERARLKKQINDIGDQIKDELPTAPAVGTKRDEPETLSSKPSPKRMVVTKRAPQKILSTSQPVSPKRKTSAQKSLSTSQTRLSPKQKTSPQKIISPAKRYSAKSSKKAEINPNIVRQFEKIFKMEAGVSDSERAKLASAIALTLADIEVRDGTALMRTAFQNVATNLRINTELREEVASGAVSPSRLCSMTNEELAPKDMREKRERMAKEAQLAVFDVDPDEETFMHLKEQLVGHTSDDDDKGELDGSSDIFSSIARSTGGHKTKEKEPDETKKSKNDQSSQSEDATSIDEHKEQPENVSETASEQRETTTEKDKQQSPSLTLSSSLEMQRPMSLLECQEEEVWQGRVSGTDELPGFDAALCYVTGRAVEEVVSGKMLAIKGRMDARAWQHYFNELDRSTSVKRTIFSVRPRSAEDECAYVEVMSAFSDADKVAVLETHASMLSANVKEAYLVPLGSDDNLRSLYSSAPASAMMRIANGYDRLLLACVCYKQRSRSRTSSSSASLPQPSPSLTNSASPSPSPSPSLTSSSEIAVPMSRVAAPTSTPAAAPPSVHSSEYSRQYSPRSPRSSQYSPPSSQYLPSTQYSAPSSQYSPPPSQYSPPPSQYSPPPSQYSPPSAKYPSSRPQYSPPSSQYPAPSSRYSPPSSRYSPPPTQYSPPRSRHYSPSKSSQRYSPPATYSPPSANPPDQGYYTAPPRAADPRYRNSYSDRSGSHYPAERASQYPIPERQAAYPPKERHSSQNNRRR